MREELNEAMRAICKMTPETYAFVFGEGAFDAIEGSVLFYPIWGGTLAIAEITGLPQEEGKCEGHFFGFHIHEGEKCTGTKEDPFADTKGHYNPKGCLHPSHAGDLPPLLGNNGYALNIFYTDRFIPEEIVGRTVVIHDMADDFKTQPSGDSGMKIACGEIMENTM